ncbi:hypothetical protein ECZU51_41280 [Escherichia coli]|nr:hypothetical protein ECZU51_41280 [Escherichia coli]
MAGWVHLLRYTAGAGVGTLVLADDDDVHLSNLQRQILFTTEDIDRPKSQVSHQRLTQLNPDIQLTALQQRLTGEALKDAVAQADVVLDCTDNMATRQEINAACVALNTPLITASAVGFGGQLMVLTPPREQGVTAACGQITGARTQLPHGGRGWPGGRGYGHFAGTGSH